MEELEELANLIRTRNSIDEKISAVIGRPAEKGHVGEYIARMIFGIKENVSATQKGHDGIFLQGPLAGKTVNVKFYGKLEGILDLQPKYTPDYYLVLTGTKSVASSSRGKTRPWTIESIFLFDSKELHSTLEKRGVKIGTATSVRKEILCICNQLYD
jgi:hypothetical protein